MKRILAFTALSLLAISFLFWLTRPVANPSRNMFFDGPDKALAHNYYMMQDRQEKRIPYERLAEAKQFLSEARMSEERDFKWKNWNTEIPGRARLLYYHEATSTLFSGSVTGGLWKNEDYKSNAIWERVSEFDGEAVNCIAVDPNSSNVLYIGTGESFTAIVNYRESTGVGNGIYKSEDGGISWSHIASTENFYFVNDLIVRDENGTSVMYAAVGSGTYQGRKFVQDGLYRTIDQGLTWQQVLPNVSGSSQSYAVSDLELAANNRIYAGAMRNSNEDGGGVVFYSDDGATWNMFTEFSDFTKDIGWSAGRTVVKGSPSNPNHVYALFTMGYTNALNQLRDYNVFLKQSMDGGATWQDIVLPSGWANIPWHALSMAVDPINENKILIGALDVFVLNDASNPSITTVDWIRLSNWAAMYDLYDPALSQEEKDLSVKKYVHADIHNIQFMDGNPNEVVITSDGGVFYSENMGVTVNIDPENPVQEFPEFKQPNSGLNTTQYYYARIHPQKGIQQTIGGAQDNGSIYINQTNQEVQFESMISGGDGGYCFWDKSNLNVKITTVYGNRYYIHIDDIPSTIQGEVNGLFVNPMDYDDESNLIYSNTATSTYGGLYKILKHPRYDTLEIFNVNSFIGTQTLGLPVVSYVSLNANLTEAITAVKLSPYSLATAKRAAIGTERGKIYLVKGLPTNVTSVRIDNNKLPDGFISSIDFGRDEKKILVTISNFGLASVWSTRDGGTTWANLERNLPDMPVRWGVFNPFDDNKIMIATEVGVWGLENSQDELENWRPYNIGIPDVRVDMIDIRTEDSTILAATHGLGLWTGKFNQGDIITKAESNLFHNQRAWLFPNPASSLLSVTADVQVDLVSVRSVEGRLLKSVIITDGIIDLHEFPNGVYFIDGKDWMGRLLNSQKIIISK